MPPGGDGRGQPSAGCRCLRSPQSVHGEDQRGESLAGVETRLQVLALLGLLVTDEDLGGIEAPVGRSIRVADTDVEHSRGPPLPEAVALDVPAQLF